MITIWHQTTTTKPDLFYKSGLIPIAIVNSNFLSWVANINRQNLNYRDCLVNPILHAQRSTSIGDILHHNDSCWQISPSGLIPVARSLPHVGVFVSPEVGDMYETFSTLQYPLSSSILIRSIDLHDYSNGWFYLETRHWEGLTTQDLLRTYK